MDHFINSQQLQLAVRQGKELLALLACEPYNSKKLLL